MFFVKRNPKYKVCVRNEVISHCNSIADKSGIHLQQLDYHWHFTIPTHMVSFILFRVVIVPPFVLHVNLSQVFLKCTEEF